MRSTKLIKTLFNLPNKTITYVLLLSNLLFASNLHLYDNTLLTYIDDDVFCYSTNPNIKNWFEFKIQYLPILYESIDCSSSTLHSNIKSFIATGADFVFCDKEVVWEAFSFKDLVNDWDKKRADDSNKSYCIDGRIFNGVLESRIGDFELMWNFKEKIYHFIIKISYESNDYDVYKAGCFRKKYNKNSDFILDKSVQHNIFYEEKKKRYIHYKPTKFDSFRKNPNFVNDMIFSGDLQGMEYVKAYDVLLKTIIGFREEIIPYLKLVFSIVCSKNKDFCEILRNTIKARDYYNKYNDFLCEDVIKPYEKSFDFEILCSEFITFLIEPEKIFFVNLQYILSFFYEIDLKFIFKEFYKFTRIHILVQNEYNDHIYSIKQVLWEYARPNQYAVEKEEVLKKIELELIFFLSFYQNHLKFLSIYLFSLLQITKNDNEIRIIPDIEEINVMELINMYPEEIEQKFYKPSFYTSYEHSSLLFNYLKNSQNIETKFLKYIPDEFVLLKCDKISIHAIYNISSNLISYLRNDLDLKFFPQTSEYKNKRFFKDKKLLITNKSIFYIEMLIKKYEKRETTLSKKNNGFEKKLIKDMEDTIQLIENTLKCLDSIRKKLLKIKEFNKEIKDKIQNLCKLFFDLSNKLQKLEELIPEKYTTLLDSITSKYDGKSISIYIYIRAIDIIIEYCMYYIVEIKILDNLKKIKVLKINKKYDDFIKIFKKIIKKFKKFKKMKSIYKSSDEEVEMMELLIDILRLYSIF